MTRKESKALIPSLLLQWKNEHHPGADNQSLEFSDFYSWLKDTHPSVLQFRSTLGPAGDVEQWFDQEFSQGWRN